MELTSVLFAGVGGQGIILASKAVAKCAFYEGLAVKETEVHGMAQRGGSVISHVRFGAVVYSPLIPLGGADFFVALEELEGLRYVAYLKKNGRIILNHRQIAPVTVNPDTNPYPAGAKERLEEMGFRVDAVNALDLAKEIGNLRVENVILTGMLSAYLPFSEGTWERVIRESVPAKTVDINMDAFARGRKLIAI